MDFLNLYHVNLLTFTTFFFGIIYFTNMLFVKFLMYKKIYDINEKSKNNNIHTGFGLSFVFITIFFLLYFFLFEDSESIYFQLKYLPIPISVIVLGFIGFLDDYKGTPVHIRLIIFFLCCFLSTSSISNSILPLIPSNKITLALLTIFWVYTINISNFLDGGDKYYVNFILPSTLFFIFYYSFINQDLIRFKINILIFLYFFHFNFYNKGPNKFFLGDTGSLVFGYLYCFNILNLIENREIVLSVIMSIFLFTDVTLTLFLRVINKKNIFSRHKGFFFHISKFLGRSNKSIAFSILFTNIGLVILAIIYKLYFDSILILFLSIFIIILHLGYLLKYDVKNLKYTYLN